jgi:ATP-binding cassette subfamily F protein 3
MIRISNLSLAFRERRVFAGLNWVIPSGSRFGLVGDNGAGKTTLFRCILGLVSPDDGIVETAKGLSLGYLPQDMVELGEGTVLDFLKDRAGITQMETHLAALEEQISHLPANAEEERRILLERHDHAAKEFALRNGYVFPAMAGKVLKGLGFRDDALGTLCGTFSGGWKMRLLLAALLLADPDVLLLDEPTNHLDTESMEWLEGYLKDFRGTLIAISHDRRFLDKMASQIAELRNGTITVYKGNYSAYLLERERRLEALRKEMELQKMEIKHIRDFIERFRYKASKASQVQSRIKMLERYQEIEIEEEARRISIVFPEAERSGRVVLAAENIGKRYGDFWVFRDLNFEVERGERIALVGVNGSGKSTLCRILGGREIPEEGKVHLGQRVQMGFFSQESSENLDYNKTVWQEIQHLGTRTDEKGKRNLLGAFLFSGDDIHKPIHTLSGGEKSRLALLKLLLLDTNLLILDEPTNHLDIATKELFQKALLHYGGTQLLVSHDRHFLDTLATRVFEIRNGVLLEYRGNYSYFIEKRAQMLSEQISEDQNAFSSSGREAGREGGMSSSASKKRDERREAAERRNQLYRKRRALEELLAPVEKRLDELEKEKRHIDCRLCEPKVLENSANVQSLLLRRASLEKEIEQLMPRWEELFLQIETLQE